MNGHCIFYDGSKGLLGDDGDNDDVYDVGIANVDQLTVPNTSCPFQDGASYTTPNGLEFEIVCDKDYGGDAGDYCIDDYPEFTCYRHADTMEDCLSFCSEANPLCQGVTYDVAMVCEL